jgi:hypothetical protein
MLILYIFKFFLLQFLTFQKDFLIRDISDFLIEILSENLRDHKLQNPERYSTQSKYFNCKPALDRTRK